MDRSRLRANTDAFSCNFFPVGDEALQHSTYNSSDIIPNGQLVSFSLLPFEVDTQIKGQSEEEGVLH